MEPTALEAAGSAMASPEPGAARGPAADTALDGAGVAVALDAALGAASEPPGNVAAAKGGGSLSVAPQRTDLSMAQVASLVEAGEELPGIKAVSKVGTTATLLADSLAPSPPKPWEVDGSPKGDGQKGEGLASVRAAPPDKPNTGAGKKKGRGRRG